MCDVKRLKLWRNEFAEELVGVKNFKKIFFFCVKIQIDFSIAT